MPPITSSIDVEMKEEQNSRLKKLGQKREDKNIKNEFLIDWIPVVLYIYREGEVLPH